MASVPAEHRVNYCAMGAHDKPLKERLIDAAERCFERQGVAHTSMRDIATEAAVSPTSLYKYFPRIDDVLGAAFVREFDRFETSFRAGLNEDLAPEAQLLEIVLAIAENVPHSAWIGALVSGPKNRTEEKALRAGRAALDQRIHDMIEAPLADLARLERLRSDLTPTMIVDWIRLLIHTFSALRHPGELTQAARREMLLAFLIPSILRPAPREKP